MSKHKKRSETLLKYMNVLSARILKTQGDMFNAELGKLNVKEINILKVLGAVEICNMKYISNSLNIPESTTTGIVDSLVRKNYVERLRTEEDRRVVKVTLSPSGKEIVENLNEQTLEIYDHMLATLNTNEQEELLALFKKIGEKFH